MVVRISICFLLVWSSAFSQSTDELIVPEKFTEYKLPELIKSPNGFNMFSDKQMVVSALQGVYNANLGLWINLPGDSIMSYARTSETEFYLRVSRQAKKLDVYEMIDTVANKIGSIDIGMFRLKKIVSSEDLIIYGHDGKQSVIYKIESGLIKKIGTHEKPIHDLIATKEQILFVSRTSIYTISEEGKVSNLVDLKFPLTGISYGPNQSFFISTIAGIFKFMSLKDSSPEPITYSINGMVHYQSNCIFVLDQARNSMFKIEYTSKK